MSLVIILLATYLIAGQLVRRWNAMLVAGLTAWTALVVAVHLVLLR